MNLDGAFDSHAGLGPTGVAAEGFGFTVATIHVQVTGGATTAHVAGTLEAAGNGNTHIQIRDESSTYFVNAGGASAKPMFV